MVSSASSGSSGKKSGGVPVTDYHLSLQYGICYGPVDAIVGVRINDKWIDFTETASNTIRTVNQPDLFGGDKKAGGIVGRIHCFFGRGSQVLSEELGAKMGRQPAATSFSGYRGIVSAWFTGGSSGSPGFRWGTNVPTVPSVAFKVRREPDLLDSNCMIGEHANPSHIIYECLRNANWGAGYTSNQVDESSFLAAAATLRTEGFGLSLTWSGQTTVETFVNGVIQTINANLVFDTVIGKWSIKLLRDDYVSEELFEINPRNGKLLNFQRRGWGEVISEVIVSWTNPENGKTETVTAQDISAHFAQDGPVSDGSRNYPGIRTAALAWKAAERDLRQVATPLVSARLSLSARYDPPEVGDVVLVNWDELDEEGDVYALPFLARVLTVTRPGKGKASYEIGVIEDIYSYGRAYTEAQASEFVSPNQDPIDVPELRLEDAPYFAVAQRFGDAAAQAFEYPRSAVSVFAHTGLSDLRSIDLFSVRPVPESSPRYLSIGTVSEIDFFLLDVDLVPEETSTVTSAGGYTFAHAAVGGILVLEDTASNTHEICIITSVSGNSMDVRRGCLDTVPGTWHILGPCWAMARTASVIDPSEVLAGSSYTYKALPVTSEGRLALGDATAHNHAVGERMYAPLRPANVAVDATQAFSFQISEFATDMVVTWANRNRISETSQVLAWTDVGVAPETGQTTTVQLFDAADLATPLVEEVGVVGETSTLDLSGISPSLAASQALVLRVFSERDGFTSWQPFRAAVDVI